MVQISKESSGPADNMSPPEQRLAGSGLDSSRTKRSPGDAPLGSASSVGRTSPQSRDALAKRAVFGAKPNTKPSNTVEADSIQKTGLTMTFSDGQVKTQITPNSTADEPQAAGTPSVRPLKPVALDTPKNPSAKPTTLPTRSNDPSAKNQLVSASLTDMTEGQSTAGPSSDNATEGTPPTTPDQRTRRSVPAVAAVAKVAHRYAETDIPHSPDEVLRDSLDNLPELPTSNSRRSGLSTRRIGQSDSRSASQSSSVGDLIRTPAEETSTPPAESVAASAPSTDSVARLDETSDGIASDANTPALPKNPTAVENRPVAEPVKLTEQELYRKLLDQVTQPREQESEAERSRRAMIAQYLMVLSGNDDGASPAAGQLNSDDQQFLEHQLAGLRTLIDPKGHPSTGRRMTEALPQFRKANWHLAAATDSLDVKNVEFCTEIESYGKVKPFPGNRFDAGQQVILYCEVENFRADKRDALFHTELSGTYDIYDASGTKIVSQLLPTDRQQSRNLIRDYFLAYQMNLPKKLATGTYRLQLTIEDVVGKKYGQAEIPFEIK